MFKDQKLKVLLVLFLVFCVASSKGIIIYNEETLVALSFVAFVLFSFHYFGSTIQDSLDERSLTIKTEYQNFLSLKQESLQQLSKEHKRISQLTPLLHELGGFTQSYLSQFSISGSRDLNNMFAQQVQQKVSQLDSSKGAVQQRLQDLIAHNIQDTVLLKIQRTGKSGSEKSFSFQDLLSSNTISQSRGSSTNSNTKGTEKGGSKISSRTKSRGKANTLVQPQSTGTAAALKDSSTVVTEGQELNKAPQINSKGIRSPKKRRT